jgi:homoserine dehydrogenase
VSLNSFQTSGSSPTASRCHIGLLGFGLIGSAIAQRLTGSDSPHNLQLTHISDRRAREKRPRQTEALGALTWTDRFDDLLASDVDIVVEAVSKMEPASDYVRAALLAGKSVVTANAQVIAHQGPALLTLAERQGRQLRFEAAVGGAMPIVRLLSDGLSGDRLVSIDAILNGTSNAVLSKMETTGCSIDEAIADACASGYADVDPSAELAGSDAATKLAILTAIGFGLRVLPAHIETRTTLGVTPLDLTDARERGGTIRQLAHAEFDARRGALTAWVAPRFVPAASLFARTGGPGNLAVMTTVHAGEISLAGTGTGSAAIAAAAIADLVLIARDRAAIVPAPALKDPHMVVGLADQKISNIHVARASGAGREAQ